MHPSLRKNEQAVADVVGTLLMIGVTVSVAAGLGAFVLAGLEGPTPPTGFKLEMALVPNCPWATGDEALTLRHLGGEALLPATFSLEVTESVGTFRLPGTQLVEGGDGDGRFEIGETWRSAGRTIAAGSVFAVDMVDTTGAPRIVFGAVLRAEPAACGGGA